MKIIKFVFVWVCGGYIYMKYMYLFIDYLIYNFIIFYYLFYLYSYIFFFMNIWYILFIGIYDIVIVIY